MICHNLLSLTGFACQPINEQGSLARINTPFCFADGDPLPVYVQTFANNLHRFFDDGQTILHFVGRGMKFPTGNKLKFLSNIAAKHGASLNDRGVIEIFTQDGATPAEVFSRYLCCLISITSWEKEHQGETANANSAAFVTEVVHALMTRTPAAKLELSPSYLGSSGKKHQLDFKLNEKNYLAIKPNTQSAAPALYKLVDITNRETNSEIDLVVVIDDRQDKKAAKDTAQVFRGIATSVINFSKIEIPVSSTVQ